MIPIYASPQPARLKFWLLCLAAVLFVGVLFALPAPLLAQEPEATAATTWYVNGSTGADNNCSTASAPCRTIQAAVDRASSGDTILVAAGTYTFGGGSGCTAQTGAPAVVCVFAKQLTLRGGYPSGNFSAADPAQNPTVIDGQGQNRGVFVLSFNSPGSTALDMAGFTVRNGLGVGIGKRPGQDAYFGFGGGMFVEFARSVVLRDMRFENNRAVGGDRSSDAGGTGAGGAISFRDTQSAILENITFTGNQANGGSGPVRGGNGQGGAIFTFRTTLTGSSLVFEGNSSHAGSSGGGGVTSDGEHADAFGGAATFQIGSKATLNEVIAHNNTATGGNAGVNAGGAFGGAFMGEQAEISINGASIRNNTARGGNGRHGWFGNGGGVMAIHSTVNINRAQIVGNLAQGGNGAGGDWGMPNGGGVMVTWVNPAYASTLNVANSIIAGNKAATGTGKEVVIGGGGGLWIQATEALIDHTTIAGNQLSGGGLFGARIQVLHTGSRGANVTIRHSLLTGHKNSVGSAVDAIAGSTVNFAGGLFFGNTYNTSVDNPIVGGNRGSFGGVGTMGSADPRYVSPAESDYHITPQSPARNKVTGVTQTVDVDNEPRSDGSPDYGADEYSPPARPPIAYYGLTSDLNSIWLRWDTDPELAGQVTRYRLTYTYTPAGGGQPVTKSVDVGAETNYTLRDLEPYVVYSITIEGLSSNDEVVASGGMAAKMTTDTNLFLPGVTRK